MEYSTQFIRGIATIFAEMINRPPAYPFPIRDVTLFNGCKVAYMDEGSGPQTLLFIHGLANYGAGWKLNIDALSKKFRCIALDLPGNGLSEGMAKYSIKAFSECIIDFIGRVGLSNVCLAGHSMGGQIAIKAALDAPFAIDKLVLCAPAGFEQFSELDKMMYQGSMQYMTWVSNDAFNLEQTMRNSFFHYPAAADKMTKDLIALMQRQPINKYREMVDQCVQSMVSEEVFSKLDRLEQPVLVLFGEKDALIPNKILHPVSTKSLGEKAVSRMRKATLHMIPDCGHFLQWEQAGHVNKSIADWLAKPRY